MEHTGLLPSTDTAIDLCKDLVVYHLEKHQTCLGIHDPGQRWSAPSSHAVSGPVCTCPTISRQVKASLSPFPLTHVHVPSSRNLVICNLVLHYSVYINCRSSDAFRSNTHPDRPFPCMSGTTVRPVSARVFSVGAQSRSMRASIGRGLRARCAQWPESSI